MNYRNGILALALPAALSGCASMPANMPLIFGETLTVGIGMSASTTDQGFDMTVGFKSRDIAIVPVTTKADGSEMLKATVTNTGATEKTVITQDGRVEHTKPASTSQSIDAFSVLGQFSSATDVGTRQIGLGKFFATGVAAQILSEGFRVRMENEHKLAKEK